MKLKQSAYFKIFDRASLTEFTSPIFKLYFGHNQKRVIKNRRFTVSSLHKHRKQIFPVKFTSTKATN
jgi:hypothetical protein